MYDFVVTEGVSENNNKKNISKERLHKDTNLIINNNK